MINLARSRLRPLRCRPTRGAQAINFAPSQGDAFGQRSQWIVARDLERWRHAAGRLGMFEHEPRTAMLLATALWTPMRR